MVVVQRNIEVIHQPAVGLPNRVRQRRRVASESIIKMKRALEAAGIEFTKDGGVSPKR
jgi:hypothetical protein